jgi:hypothetical protein
MDNEDRSTGEEEEAEEERGGKRLSEKKIWSGPGGKEPGSEN